ncbi:MAG: anti-sigma factor [Ignavibacteria bacterium]|nr:anti-sigma factor [Ignavibacteria bacterium]
MMSHRGVRRLLYEYITEEIDAATRRNIEAHLQGCARCSADLAEIREAAQLIRAVPGEEPPDEFWDALLAKVEHRIRTEEPKPVRQHFSLSGWIDSLFIVRRPVLAFALVLAVCVIAALAVWVITFPAHVPPGDVALDQPAPSQDLHVRTDQYLRRSQALLVGLANMKASDDRPVDLAVEREVSRALIHEARSLKLEHLDPFSAQVVYQLEPILVELANTHGDDSRTAIHLIRQGIFERNLLFKIRIAEVVRDSTRFSRPHQGIEF